MSDNLLLIYEYVVDMGERRGPYRAAHLEHIKSAQAAGRIGLAGATGDPPDGGALQFTGVTPGEVEAWVAADPYSTAGLVLSHKILPWNLV
jgi:uncharacterized protein YciI